MTGWGTKPTATHPGVRTPAGGGFSGGFSADFSGFGDIFETFFGGGFGGGTRQRAGPRPGADLLMKMEVTLEEAVFGAEKEVSLDHIEPCPACDGSGSETRKFTTCPTCGGSGQMRQASQSIFGSFVRMSTCTACGGRGKVPESPCKTCGGSGHRRARQTVKVKIPPGVDTGMRLRMEGYGDAGEYGAPSGDLYIEISVAPHEKFTRRGDDLETTVDITPGPGGPGLPGRGPDDRRADGCPRYPGRCAAQHRAEDTGRGGAVADEARRYAGAGAHRRAHAPD